MVGLFENAAAFLSQRLFLFPFLLVRKRVSGGERRSAPGSESPAPVRPAQPVRRHRGTALAPRTDTRTGTGDTAPLSVPRLLLRSAARRAPAPGTDTRLVPRKDVPFGTLEPAGCWGRAGITRTHSLHVAAARTRM